MVGGRSSNAAQSPIDLGESECYPNMQTPTGREREREWKRSEERKKKKEKNAND